MNTPMKTLATTFLALLLPACGNDAAGSAGDHPDEGPSHEGTHGGTIVDLSGGAGHLEVVHDEEAGTVTLYVLGAEDTTTPMPIAGTPELRLMTEDGQKIVKTEPRDPTDGKAAVFRAEDPALKVHELKGRIALAIEGVEHNPDIPHGDH